MGARYRILPYGANEWVVERRVLWFWWPETYMGGYDGSRFVREFLTEAAAEEWIKTKLQEHTDRAEWRRTADRRLSEIEPREFP